MSVFRVKLQNIKQGLLDLDPSTHPVAAGSAATYGQLGSAFGTSLQRQMWAAGPNRTYRLLVDGATFTDCNYWKQFAYPQTDYEYSFIEVVTDDGSVWSDVPEENTFLVGSSFTLATSYNTTNKIDFVNTYGGPATFLQVQNNDGSIAITGELNGDTNATFTLAAGASQIFNNGDIRITQIRLKSASGTPSATVLASVRSVCNS